MCLFWYCYHKVCKICFSVPPSQFLLLSSPFSVPPSQFLLLSSPFSVPPSQFPLLSSYFSVPPSQFHFLSSSFSVPPARVLATESGFYRRENTTKNKQIKRIVYFFLHFYDKSYANGQLFKAENLNILDIS